MFRLIDKDERLLSVANDIEIPNAQVERDGIRFLIYDIFYDYYFFFIQLGHMTQQFPQNIRGLVIFIYLMLNLLLTYDNEFFMWSLVLTPFQHNLYETNKVNQIHT